MLRLGIRETHTDREPTKHLDLKQSGWFQVRHKGQVLRLRFEWPRRGGSNPAVIFDAPEEFRILRPGLE